MVRGRGLGEGWATRSSSAALLVCSWHATAVPFSRPLGRTSYYFGLAANELPFAAFLWMLLLPTALAFADGDIDSAG
ncbi:hypothetical protein [Nonomuraea jabiensis]|uniref:Uncharacterized protein n=1 Tax=Nonomuraea jabiensis TaxID=882448 RepID=A0A7W9G775_9ACTN|nr:hypothetical protein [Nonomuraea jabiensis]MBB5778418.1 hypothetical protein [Nonomuraea jabiensis]